MRGASAVQSVLAGLPDARVRVFIVWEPILFTDIPPPITPVLRRAADLRVSQYWDPNRLVATRLTADARPPQPEADCCVKNGILWDMVAVYPKGVIWDAQMPVATIFNGPVTDVSEALMQSIGR